MYSPTPPANPDIKHELKKQLLTLPARSFEFFAGEFLVYVGLEAVSVTRYIGDGGIDAQGNLVVRTLSLRHGSNERDSFDCPNAGSCALQAVGHFIVTVQTVTFG